MKTKLSSSNKKFKGEWLYSIPSDWDQKKMRFLFCIKKIISGELGHDVISITQGGARIKDVESGDGQLSMDYSKYQIVKEGDFLMNHMDLLTGFIDISKFNGVTSPDYRVFKTISNEVYPSFFLYLFQYCYFSKIFYGYGKGVAHYGRWRLPAKEFSNFFLPLPSLNEQKIISKKLDGIVPELDQLICEFRKIIDIVYELKLKEITELISKGINLNVPMKKNKDEILDTLPSHWRFYPIKYLCKKDNSGIWGEDQDNYFKKYVPVKVATTKNISSQGSFDIENMETRYIFEEEFPKYICKKGDIVIVKSSGSADNVVSGKCGYIEDDNLFAFGNFLMRIQSYKNIVNPKFLFYFLSSNITKQRVLRMVSSTTYPNLKINEYMSSKIPLPPLDEQEYIVDLLDKKIEYYNNLISFYEKKIELLIEQKRSLVGSLVTGKTRLVF